MIVTDLSPSAPGAQTLGTPDNPWGDIHAPAATAARAGLMAAADKARLDGMPDFDALAASLALKADRADVDAATALLDGVAANSLYAYAGEAARRISPFRRTGVNSPYGANYFYIRKTGDDGNGGANPDDAFLTIARALAELERVEGAARINIGPGVWEENNENAVVCVTQRRNMGGFGSWIQGAGMDQTILRGVGGSASGQGIRVDEGCSLSVVDLKIENVERCVMGRQNSVVSISNVDFGDASNIHINSNGLISAGNYRISGGAQSHFYLENNCICGNYGSTVTLLGNPKITTFMWCRYGTIVNGYGNAYVGAPAAGCRRYYVGPNSVVQTAGGGENYYPGDTAGIADSANGGRYI